MNRSSTQRGYITASPPIWGFLLRSPKKIDDASAGYFSNRGCFELFVNCLCLKMVDVEPVDQKKYLEDSSKPRCVRSLIEYQHDIRDIDVAYPLLLVYRQFIDINTDDTFEDAFTDILTACVKRVEGDETREKHCTGQYFDYWHCIDQIVATKLFDKLK